MTPSFGRFPGPILVALIASLAVSACNSTEEGLVSGETAAPKPIETKDELRRTYGKGRRAEDRQLYEVALSYYQEAAPSGYTPALIGLGRLYAQGSPEVPQDYVQAEAYYRQAIDLGAGYEAELPYGVMNLDGLGLPANPREADRWFRRGALTVVGVTALASGEKAEAEKAETADAAAAKEGLLERLFAPFTKPDAFDAALAWAEGLDQQEPDALYAESVAYRRGIERPIDLVLADRLRERAAQRGFPEAAYELGMARLYPEGGIAGPQADVQGGLQMLWRAAESGMAPAQRDLGRYYAEASDHPFNQERAYYWLLRARESGGPAGELLPTVKDRLDAPQIDLVKRNLEIGWVYPP